MDNRPDCEVAVHPRFCGRALETSRDALSLYVSPNSWIAFQEL
jgi:hypothetical protein